MSARTRRFVPSAGPALLRGFTLIEMMIIVAILAVLVAYAIPSYREYLIKQQRISVRTAAESLMQQYVTDSMVASLAGPNAEVSDFLSMLGDGSRTEYCSPSTPNGCYQKFIAPITKYAKNSGFTAAQRLADGYTNKSIYERLGQLSSTASSDALPTGDLIFEPPYPPRPANTDDMRSSSSDFLIEMRVDGDTDPNQERRPDCMKFYLLRLNGQLYRGVEKSPTSGMASNSAFVRYCWFN